MNIFERAARGKWRFASPKGDLTAEQLFDLPLTGNKGFSLDAIAQSIDAALQTANGRSFVQAESDTADTIRLRGQLELIIAVIDGKQAQARINESRAARESEAVRLEQALQRREDADLENLSADELKAKLAQIRAT